MPVCNMGGVVLLPKVIVLNPKDGPAIVLAGQIITNLAVIKLKKDCYFRRY